MGKTPCCEKVGLKRGRWTAEEDEILTNYIQANGEGSWRSLPKNAGLLRCGKSCRLRWINYLKTDLKRGNITSDEEAIIIKLRATLGNRTDNEIKNYWNSRLSRKVESLRIPSDERLPQAVVELAKKGIQQEIIKQRYRNDDQILWHDELDQDFIFSCLWNDEGENVETVDNNNNNNNNDNNNNNYNNILSKYGKLDCWDWECLGGEIIWPSEEDAEQDNNNNIMPNISLFDFNDNIQNHMNKGATVEAIDDPMQSDLVAWLLSKF
ncbi:unnamed protein product [Withania somnifera]